MLHRRCVEREKYLERLLDEEREKNAKLTEQIVVMAHAAPIPLTVDGEGAKVYFMDDNHIVELEREGRGPS